MNIQRLFGSQRALKTVEDFTEFEQRAAYFDGDPVIATKKGVNLLERGSQVHFMAEFQELLDFPPAPKLGRRRQARPEQGDRAEMRGQELFFGKAQCATCHPAPYYTDNLMHNLKVERFYKPQMINGLMATARRADQDVPAARHQGVAAVPARRPAADAGGHGRVLQPDPGAGAGAAGEGGSRRVHASPISGRTEGHAAESTGRIQFRIPGVRVRPDCLLCIPQLNCEHQAWEQTCNTVRPHVWRNRRPSVRSISNQALGYFIPPPREFLVNTILPKEAGASLLLDKYNGLDS